MIRQGLYTSTLGKMMKWAQAQSLWAYHANSSCCANEVLQAVGCRYDLERFGCVFQVDPRQADLLIVSGVITGKLAPHIKELYDRMPSPKYVIAVGACANCGGAFSKDPGYSVEGGVDQVIPVDIYVPGCPPRPEAIMDGLILLQEKISGIRQARARS